MGINWLGAAIVTRRMLTISKAGKEDSESVASKMARQNFGARVNTVMQSMNARGGASIHAATAIRYGGWFTDMTDEALVEAMNAGLEDLAANKKGDIALKMSAVDVGDLTFPEFTPQDNDGPQDDDDDDFEDFDDLGEDDDDEEEDEE